MACERIRSLNFNLLNEHIIRDIDLDFLAF